MIFNIKIPPSEETYRNELGSLLFLLLPDHQMSYWGGVWEHDVFLLYALKMLWQLNFHLSGDNGAHAL